jgi:chemotaxis-related protein WspD
MVVVEKESSRWVFLVDEMYGVQRINPDELQNVPATVSKTTGTYTTAIINWQNTSVSYLDEELLFYTLNKKLL